MALSPRVTGVLDPFGLGLDPITRQSPSPGPAASPTRPSRPLDGAPSILDRARDFLGDVGEFGKSLASTARDLRVAADDAQASPAEIRSQQRTIDERDNLRNRGQDVSTFTAEFGTLEQVSGILAIGAVVIAGVWLLVRA